MNTKLRNYSLSKYTILSMKRKPPKALEGNPKQAILDDVVEFFLREGFEDKSIRSIGKKIGVSHRMINYHFKTVPAFWTEVVMVVTARIQTDSIKLFNLSTTYDAPLIEHYKRMMDKRMLAAFRLDLEVTLMSLDNTKQLKYIQDMNETWVDFLIKYIEKTSGKKSPANRILARFVFSSMRGLLLDHLVFRNRVETEAAMDLFANLIDGTRKTELKK